jgi:hypothetical protein
VAVSLLIPMQGNALITHGPEQKGRFDSIMYQLLLPDITFPAASSGGRAIFTNHKHKHRMRSAVRCSAVQCRSVQCSAVQPTVLSLRFKSFLRKHMSRWSVAKLICSFVTERRATPVLSSGLLWNTVSQLFWTKRHDTMWFGSL